MSDLTIKYKDQPIAELSESGTKTLKTAGKYCEDDISVEYAKSAGGVDMGITGATVGQIAKIAAVDASGVPTAWSPVDMPSGEEKWEKIEEIELNADTAMYVLADFGIWRKAKVIMRRDVLVSGLDKNVWAKVIAENVSGYNCGYIAKAYGYTYWEFTAEVNELFISSSCLENNNINVQSTIQSTCTLTPLDKSPSDYKFVLFFADTSVIQDGDKVTVIGVRR